MGSTQSLPAAVETERTVLGAILLDDKRIWEAQEGLIPDDFLLDAHRLIFKAMLDLANDNRPVDIMTLSDLLGKQRNLEYVGGVSYISQLIDGVPHMPTIVEYTGIVKEKAKLRRLHLFCTKAAAQVIAQEGEPDEIIGELENSLMHLLDDKASQRSLAQIGMGFLKNLHRFRAMAGDTLGLTYGIPELDRLTTGIREAEYILIGGRPAQGKSAWARMIAYQNAKRGEEVAIFTPEMTEEQYISLMVPYECLIPYWVIRDPRELTQQQVEIVTNATDRLMQLPMHIDGTSGITVDQLVARAKMRIARGAKLVIVDYLQLVQAPKAKNVRERVNAVSGALRDLAKSTKVPVIALSQLTRPGDKNPNEYPTMFHLKESGDLEQDAVNIFFVFRPQQDGRFTGEDELVIAKQRFGEAGLSVHVSFNQNKVCFQERGGFQQ